MNLYTEYRKHYLREWRCWYRMHRRCELGIDYCENVSVCDEWTGPQGFVNFVDYMGTRPSNEHHIFRKDKSQDYTPSNTEWATRSEDWRRRDNTCTLERAPILHTYKRNQHHA